MQHASEWTDEDVFAVADALLSFSKHKTTISRVDRIADVVLKYMQAHRESRWVAESAIRVAIGNTPDVSKAIRKLFRDGKLERMGRGGRKDCFMYALRDCR